MSSEATKKLNFKISNDQLISCSSIVFSHLLEKFQMRIGQWDMNDGNAGWIERKAKIQPAVIEDLGDLLDILRKLSGHKIHMSTVCIRGNTGVGGELQIYSVIFVRSKVRVASHMRIHKEKCTVKPLTHAIPSA